MGLEHNHGDPLANNALITKDKEGEKDKCLEFNRGRGHHGLELHETDSQKKQNLKSM